MHRPIADTADVERVAETTYAALLEAGRPDLADLVQFVRDVPDDGSACWNLEPADEVPDADFAIMCRGVDVALGREQAS